MCSVCAFECSCVGFCGVFMCPQIVVLCWFVVFLHEFFFVYFLVLICGFCGLCVCFCGVRGVCGFFMFLCGF